jgi:polysaccharide export outer membrane protein
MNAGRRNSDRAKATKVAILAGIIACCAAYSPAQSNRGAEQLRPSAASAETAPRDEYRLGPEDQITITVRFADELNNKTVPIDSAGYINIPFAGRVSAAGLTVAELQTSIAAKLTPYFTAPQVVINIERYGSKPVAVMGEVHNPAVYQLRGRETLMQLLSAAGGLTQEAGSKLEITRQMIWGELPLPNARLDPSGKSSTAELDLSALLAGNESENILLCSNDTVTVPRVKLIYVLGEVHKPGGFPLHDTQTASVLQAVALAEGPLVTASTEHARILRLRAGGARQEIPVNLRNILERDQPDISLKPDDILYLPNSKAKSATLRGLEAAIQMGTGVVIWGRF